MFCIENSWTIYFVFQDAEKLHPLFQVAMQLSTSTKPYDCVTASYLLKFLIHQKGLLKVCFKKHPPFNTFQQDEDMPNDPVEENTLAGQYIYFLIYQI